MMMEAEIEVMYPWVQEARTISSERGARDGVSLRGSGRNRSCRHLDVEPLASRTERE